jgi:hypothetical protein
MIQETFASISCSRFARASQSTGGPIVLTIQLAYVPPYGSFDNLKGQIWHVQPADYKVAVYIRVGSGWWTKPFWNAPLTSINCDGTWTSDITTGGNDHQANTIAAYLVLNGYDPFSAHGQSTLPTELIQNSVAYVEVTRSP